MDGPKRMIYIREVAFSCNTEEELIEEMLRLGLIAPRDSSREDEFLQQEDMELIRTASRLHSMLGVNLEGVEVILNMRQRIELLQGRLRALEQQMQYYERGEGSARIIEIE